jgi:hypothetical protein
VRKMRLHKLQFGKIHFLTVYKLVPHLGKNLSTGKFV